MATTNDSTASMNNVIRFPGAKFETPASAARKPTKRTKPSPALSPEDAAMLAAFHWLSSYGREMAEIKMNLWVALEGIAVEFGKPIETAWFSRGV